MDQSCFYIEVLCCCCCWCLLNSLSMCFEMLFLFSFFFFFFFLFFILLTSIKADVFWLVISIMCMLSQVRPLSEKLYRGEVYWSGPGSFYAILVSVSNIHFLRVVSCVLRTFKKKKRKRKSLLWFLNRKKNTLTFTVLMWDHNETYFLQRNAFWTMVLKMSILIFTCYMRMYIFVIYNWINFIGCEIKNCFVLLLFLLFNVQVMEFTSEYKCFYTLQKNYWLKCTRIFSLKKSVQ